MWQLFVTVCGEGEKLSEDHTQWRINHEALRNAIDWEDPLTGSMEPWEVNRAMILIKREMNAIDRDSMQLIRPVEEDQGE